MMIEFQYFLEALLNPYFICLFILAISAACLCILGDNRFVRAAILLSLFGFILFSTRWLPDRLVAQFENQYPLVSTANKAIRWVVVLGGGHREPLGMPANDELSPVSVLRLVEGVRLYRQLPEATLLLSGGSGFRGKTSEAAYLATIASWFYISPHHLLLEEDSVNTADEALAIKSMVHSEPFYLVTSAMHMPRAMALCESQGLHPVAAPTDFSHDNGRATYMPNTQNLAHTSTVWHEMLGVFWAKLRGLIA